MRLNNCTRPQSESLEELGIISKLPDSITSSQKLEVKVTCNQHQVEKWQLVNVLEIKVSITYHQIIFKPSIYVRSKKPLGIERTAPEQNCSCY